MRRKRVFVDLDAEAGALVEAELIARRATRTDAADRRGEEPLGGEAVGDARRRRRAARSACTAWAAAAIPTGPSSALER